MIYPKEIVIHRLSMDLACPVRLPRLSDHMAVYDFLIEASVVLGMRIAVPPIVVTFPIPAAAWEQTDDCGVSGVVVWVESHGAVHTWPESGFVEIDFASCKSFSIDKAISHVLSFWSPLKYKVYNYKGGRRKCLT